MGRVLALLTGVKFRWTVLLLPLNILEMYLLALGIGLMLGSLFVKYRDVGYLWEVALQLFFYGTPIIYPITMVSATHPFMAKPIQLGYGLHADLVVHVGDSADRLGPARYRAGDFGVRSLVLRKELQEVC